MFARAAKSLVRVTLPKDPCMFYILFSAFARLHDPGPHRRMLRSGKVRPIQDLLRQLLIKMRKDQIAI